MPMSRDCTVEVDALAVKHAEEGARERWGTALCEAGVFAGHIGLFPISPDQLSLYGHELYLAAACAAGTGAALRLFEREYLANTAGKVRRLNSNQAFVDDVLQSVRERLLAPPKPRIASYAGGGPLLGWVRVAVARAAVDLARARGRVMAELSPEELIDGVAIAEPQAGRYRAAIQLAIHKVFADLGSRERNLMRLHHAEGLTLERLATMYGVHRATVARWLADVRRSVFDAVETNVRTELRLSASEFRSALGLVRSQLDASISQLFRTPSLG